MAEIAQKPWIDNKLSDDSAADGYNFPRHVVRLTEWTVDDDSIHGFWYQSTIMDITNNRLYLCVDPTPEAAVWVEQFRW